MNETVSVIMPVFNQEDLIVRICHGIIKNLSSNIKEIIIILDGCTDKTEERLNSILHHFPIPPKIAYAPNVFEVKATNIGFKMSTCEYSFFLQDDMLITEPDFGERLLKPFRALKDVVYVSARDAVDVVPAKNDITLDFVNVAGKDVGIARNVFSIRDALNRGPILFNNEKMQTLGYMDEIYAPQNLDDVDVGLKSYINYGWLCGAYAFEYISKPEWGTGRKNYNSWLIFEASNAKNHRLMRERYRDFLSIKEKHDADLIIE